jgi:hypothetical protein
MKQIIIPVQNKENNIKFYFNNTWISITDLSLYYNVVQIFKLRNETTELLETLALCEDQNVK